MELRRKIISVVAAAGLTLTFGAAVVAEDSTGVEVKLTPTECTVGITQSNISFGEFEYIGNEWVRTGGSGYHDVDITVGLPEPSGECVATFSLTNSSNTDYGAANADGVTLPGANFNLDLWDVGSGINGLGAPVSATFDSTSTNPLNASLWLESVPDAQAPGEYTGTLNATVVSAP